MSSPVKATMRARIVSGSQSVYPLSRTTSNTSRALGLISWCDAYASKQQNEGVVFYTLEPMSMETLRTGPLTSSMSAPLDLLPLYCRISRLQYDESNAATRGSAAQVGIFSSRRGWQPASCESELPLEYFVTLNSSSGQISASPEFLCRAGTNDVFFDIGTVAGGSFTETFPNAFQMSVPVLPGDFTSFMLVAFARSFAAQTYTLIDSLEAMFLDSVLNEVSRNARMSLSCTSGSVSIYPTQPHRSDLQFNFTCIFAAFLPACFRLDADRIAVCNWNHHH